MTETEQLAEHFHHARPRLQRMAMRILGSPPECEDALQEGWLRISRADRGAVEKLDAWMTTVVARVCLDALKRRESRREELTPEDPRRDLAATGAGEHPEDEVMLADSIGLAMSILLDALAPAERVAFVLHDMFDVPFDDIAQIVGKTPEAARQLASRARRRVSGVYANGDPVKQRRDELVRAFLEASRAGKFYALIALLDPAAALRADAAVMAMGGAEYWQTGKLESGIEGADAVARMFLERARAAVPVLLDGEPGAIWMHDGAVRVAFRFTIEDERIARIELVADSGTLARISVER